MRIYNICDHLSISVIKHVQLQKMLGHDTTTCFNKCGLPRFANDRVGLAFKPPSLFTVEEFCKASDVVVIHTSTSSTRLLEVNTHGKPLIWACHDYVVGAHDEFKDKIAACLVPSAGYKRMMGDQPFPIHIIHRKLSIRDWPKWRKDQINATIMCGVVSDHPKMPYRDYSFAADALKGRLVVQSAQLPSMMAERYLIMETVDPSIMFQRMAMFETSWCGCGNDKIDFHTIINNKFFESIACGSVPILYRSREMEQYGFEYGCAVNWEGQYPDQHQLKRCRENIRVHQAIHCLESEAPKLRVILSDL